MTATSILRWSDSDSANNETYEDSTPQIRIYNVKTNTDALLWFFNNPLDDPTHDWYQYKELRAFNGLRSGHKLPPGLAVFPAIQNDPLTSLIEPGKYDENGEVWAKKVIAVNAIFLGGVMGEKDAKYEPQPGQHIIVKFSSNLGTQAKTRLIDEGEGFDCRDYAWRVSVDVPIGKDGTPIYVSSQLRMMKKTLEHPVDDIEPYKIDEILGDIRARVEDAVREINVSMASNSIISEPVAVEDPFVDDDIAVEDLEKAVAAFGTDATEVDPFDGVADTRLKKLLVDAGVAAPRGASREVLINLANSIGWTSAADLPIK
jgi:hypothetical protein